VCRVVSLREVLHLNIWIVAGGAVVLTIDPKRALGTVERTVKQRRYSKQLAPPAAGAPPAPAAGGADDVGTIELSVHDPPAAVSASV
jgi:hypothetical protein